MDNKLTLEYRPIQFGLFPGTKSNARQLEGIGHACRCVWNKMLAFSIEDIEEYKLARDAGQDVEPPSLTAFSLEKKFTQLRRETPWLQTYASNLCRAVLDYRAVAWRELLKGQKSVVDDALKGELRKLESFRGKKVRTRRAHWRDLRVWSGPTGWGKTQLLLNCACHWIDHGINVFLVSRELTPEQTLRLMVRQCNGGNNTSPQNINNSLAWLSGQSEQGGQLFMLTKQELLETLTYCRRRFGCGQLIVDSFIGLGTDDRNAQASMALDLAQCCKDEDSHTHPVVDNRKSDEASMQGTMGIKGSSELRAIAAIHLEIMRRRDVEAVRQMRDRGEALTENRSKLEKAWGSVLMIHKQRNGEYEGSIGLEFHADSFQYTKTRHTGGIAYVKATAPQQQDCARHENSRHQA